MAVIPCKLAHTVHLVIRPQQLAKARSIHPDVVPNNKEDIEAELNRWAAIGIAVLLEPGDKSDELQIVFCTLNYELRAGLTELRQDGYFVYAIGPTLLRRHRKLSRRAVRVQAPRWRIHSSPAAINNTNLGGERSPKSGFKNIVAAWEKTAVISKSVEPTKGPTQDQIAYLEQLEDLIELTKQIELDRFRNADHFVYNGVSPVATARIVGDEYRFTLTEPTSLEKKNYVRVAAAETGLKGSNFSGMISDISEKSMQIKFRRQIHLDQLPTQGVIQKSTSTKPFELQQEAVRALRYDDQSEEQECLNTYLLDLVTRHQFLPYEKIELPGTNGFNAPQHTAIGRAEKVPDMLLVLGPPGTGKTTTIIEVAKREALLRRKRILITSKNNKAVDNVLEDLDTKEINVLKIGRPEVVDKRIEPLLIDEQAQALQKTILTNIQAPYEALSHIVHDWSDIENRLQQLQEYNNSWREATKRVETATNKLHHWQRECYQRQRSTLEARQKQADHSLAQVNRIVRTAERWVQWIALLKSAERWPLVGSFCTVLHNWAHKRWQYTKSRYEPAARAFKSDHDIYVEARQRYLENVKAGSRALELKEAVAISEEKCSLAEEHVLTKFRNIASTFDQAGTGDLASSPEELTPQTITEFIPQTHHTKSLAVRRLEILEEWRQLLEQRYQALYPTLIRLANVIGATCIGIGTDTRFDDLEFDLVIADEAGQIQVTDLLVPLVRARRAMLVGDHKQLPPFVDDELKNELKDDPNLSAIVQQSLFERLFEDTPETHRVVLDTQYRMPKVIANFVRDNFYDGDYKTGKQEPYADPIFKRPMIFIDTANARDNHERPNKYDNETLGYTNPLEAKIICDLCLIYLNHFAEDTEEHLGVIVPYDAQAVLIRELIQKHRSTISEKYLEELVATVDSFQGKQRRVIIFGFTRSNRQRRIGFLRELRRLNVTITRAKSQLILIGDSRTLENGDDRDFASLLKKLTKYIKYNGDYLEADDFIRKLR